jgi:hypothetical protein
VVVAEEVEVAAAVGVGAEEVVEEAQYLQTRK